MELVIMCGPCGSGKSTYALKNYPNHNYINQDLQGKAHLELFKAAIELGHAVIVDRMSFDKKQRAKYLDPAKTAGYSTKIIVLHVNQATCLERMPKREGHPTIQDEKTARSALHTFFSKYERPEPGEADEIDFRYPEGVKQMAILCDLDGTLCNIDHRLHFVRGEGKKDWKNFLYNIPGDSVNTWCEAILRKMSPAYQIVYCSGRGGECRGETKRWLEDNNLWELRKTFNNAVAPPGEHHLYMRERGDHRTDYIVKEIILDFEILTRFTPLFAIDDRKQVVDMWRRRGIVCLHCAEGNF